MADLSWHETNNTDGVGPRSFFYQLFTSVWLQYFKFAFVKRAIFLDVYTIWWIILENDTALVRLNCYHLVLLFVRLIVVPDSRVCMSLQFQKT